MFRATTTIKLPGSKSVGGEQRVRVVNFGEMTTKLCAMYSYRACCQIALMARPPSLFISWRSARSLLMCNDSTTAVT